MDKRRSNEYVRIRGEQMLDMLRLKAQPGAVIGKKRLWCIGNKTAETGGKARNTLYYLHAGTSHGKSLR